MPTVDDKLIQEGADAARDRARREFPDGFPELPPGFFEAAKRVLEQWPHELSPRFVKLIVELGAVAAISRAKYTHPPLTDEEALAFLAHSAVFFNSFKHR